MTKAELIALLEPLPDDATVCISGVWCDGRRVNSVHLQPEDVEVYTSLVILDASLRLNE